MSRTTEVDVPAVLRAARAVKQATLAEVGAHAGYSPSAMSRILNGRMTVGDVALRRIAEFLEIPPQQLGLGVDTAPTSPSRPVVAARVTASREWEDEVRRRSFLALGAAGISTVAAGTGPAEAAPVPTAPGGDPLEQALFSPTQRVRLPDLASALARARADFRAARYDRLRTTMPALLAGAEAERDATSGLRRERANAALARAHVIATEVAVKGDAEYAWVTADRALTAARACGSPVAVGEAARVLAITMRRSGRIASAVHLLTATAADLGDRSADALAVRTSLLLTAAYTAATGGTASAAYSLIEEAQETAGRVPPGLAGELFTVEATAEQCALYRIGIATALGDPDAGVRHAFGLDPARLPTTERRARYYTDTARMWDALGEGRRTYESLLAMERVAPEEVRRPSVRAITARLVHSPTRLSGLRPFAARTGAFAG
ncbi:helix-turn-helix domain-containing protein [Kitasatospora sp. NPDC057541]|uniref:helix-turn-helix domain-containing protein n=1 Tax=unclassified Kitasatospora TaxID=2633591 RepID=UPI00367F07BF